MATQHGFWIFIWALTLEYGIAIERKRKILRRNCASLCVKNAVHSTMKVECRKIVNNSNWEKRVLLKFWNTFRRRKTMELNKENAHYMTWFLIPPKFFFLFSGSLCFLRLSKSAITFCTISLRLFPLWFALVRRFPLQFSPLFFLFFSRSSGNFCIFGYFTPFDPTPDNSYIFVFLIFHLFVYSFYFQWSFIGGAVLLNF